MNEVSNIGLDRAKNIYQAHGAAGDGSVLFRRKLSRRQLLDFLSKQPPCIPSGLSDGPHYLRTDLNSCSLGLDRGGSGAALSPQLAQGAVGARRFPPHHWQVKVLREIGADSSEAVEGVLCSEKKCWVMTDRSPLVRDHWCTTPRAWADGRRNQPPCRKSSASRER